MTRAVFVAAAFLVLAAPAPARARLRWSPCFEVEAACAHVRVPLDRSGAVPGTVRLRLARFAAPRGRPTLLYLSGGPGGAGVAEFNDVSFELGGLGRRYRLVSYDQRGTGFSGLLRCPGMERDPRLRSTRAGAQCAVRLGARRAFYGTRDSVEDVEALRRALGVEKLTLFGISYGTKLALAYARAYPQHVERLALDSVLDPDDDDAFGVEPFQAMAATLASLCPARCRGVSADPPADLARLAARLRRAPLRGSAYGLRGRRPATLTSVALSDLMLDADYEPAIRAGMPAAVRAALDHRDPAPLLRLIAAGAELAAVQPDPRSFSAARYATVCEETPLPWPRGTPFGQREGIARAGADRLGPGAFFPFSYAEARADEIELCLRWPEASPAPATGGDYPAQPALILQGGEDMRTPPAGSERVASRLAGARRLVLPGVGHAATVGDPSRCGTRRLLAFLRGRPVAPCRRVPTLVPATAVPPVSLRAVPRAPGVPGLRGRAIAALDLTLDDLTFSLSPALGSPLDGPGLRGGTFRLGLGGRRIVLRRLRAVHGLRVSGVLPRRGSASLRLSGARAVTGRVRISPRGVLRGRLGGRRVRARLRAGLPRAVAFAAARRRVPIGSGARRKLDAAPAQFRHKPAFSSVRRRS